MKIPDRGFCIAPRGEGYTQCFPLHSGSTPSGSRALKNAVRAARKLAESRSTGVSLIQVQNRGNDRFIIGEIEPRHWRRAR